LASGIGLLSKAVGRNIAVRSRSNLQGVSENGDRHRQQASSRKTEILRVCLANPKVACKLSREKNGQEQEQLVTSSAKRRTGCESLDSRHRSIPLLLPAADRYGDVTARDRSSTRFSDGSGSVDGSGGKVNDTTFYGEAITPVNPAVFK
jgi:hypothetical protein